MNQGKNLKNKLQEALNYYSKIDEIPLIDKKILHGLMTKKMLNTNKKILITKKIKDVKNVSY